MGFLFIVFGIVIFAVWRNIQNALDLLRSEMEALSSETRFLRTQLADLRRAASSSASPPVAAKEVPANPPAKESQPAPAARLEPMPDPMPTPAKVTLPPPVAAFRHAAPIVQPVEPVRPVPPVTPVPPVAPVQFPAAALLIEPVQEPVKSAPIPPPPMNVPSPDEFETRASARERIFSLEERLGANWLNKLGIAILVIGLAFFLALKLETWGPAGKVITGYAVSLALLAGGVWLEQKAIYRVFARGGIGGGWALAFFTTFALHHIAAARVLDSLAADLVLMLIVASGMVAHSLRYRSQTVTGLAFMLGFATLLTSHLEGADGTVVFSLTASVVLAVALVVVTTVYHWAWLELAGMIAVYGSHLVWLTRVLPDNRAAFTEFWPSTVLILIYWMIFRLAYVLRTPRDQKEENLSSLSAVFNSIGVLGLLKYQSAHPEWAFWALMALGAVEMGLAFRVRSRRRQAFVVLSTIATVLLISAVPLKFHGVSWPVLWLVEAQILAVCGLRLGEPVFRRLGLLAGLVTGGVLAFYDIVPLLWFRLNYPDAHHHLTLTASLVLAATLYWIHAEVYPRRWPQIAAAEVEALALKVTSWLGLAAAATALWVVLPDMWVPVGWLALVLILAAAGHKFGGVVLALEADLLALGAAAVLLSEHIGSLVFLRLNYPDPSHHPAETAVLGLAAAGFWVRSEVFPRVLPKIGTEGTAGFDIRTWHGAMLPFLSWLGAGAAAAALWVALPDMWVPVGWLALVLLMALVANKANATPLAIEADVLALVSAAVLAFHHIAPLVEFRLNYPDPSRHPGETAILALAALAFWVRSEVFPRVLPRVASWGFDLAAWQSLVLPSISWLGTGVAAAALWVVLPASWVPVGWLALVIVLGLAGDWVKAQTLALQADFLAVAALLGLFVWDLWTQGRWGHQAPLIAAVVLLYGGMRRKTVPTGSSPYVAPAYSWAASLLLAFVAADLSSGRFLIPVWAALGIALFEIGRFSPKDFLRWQGLLLAALGFARYLAGDLTSAGPAAPIAILPDGSLAEIHRFSLTNSLLLEVLVLAGVGYLLLERTRNREICTRAEHIVGLIADAMGTLSIALWFAYRFPSTWVPVPEGETWVTPIWAGMAAVLLALAWLLRRRTFLVQALVLVAAVIARAFFLDLIVDTPTDFWHGPLFHLGASAFILLSALPFAYRLKAEDRFTNPTFVLPPDLAMLLRFPEQSFFFAAFLLEVVALAIKLSSGHITIAWSVLGLAVFLFALAVGERSFRLAGLGLLLVSVAKILVMDVWQLSPSDRYTTLIVLGLALVSVSFLYTRFASVIRKFL